MFEGTMAGLLSQLGLFANPHLSVPSCPLSLLRFTYQWLWIWLLWVAFRTATRLFPVTWQSRCQGNTGRHTLWMLGCRSAWEPSSVFSTPWIPDSSSQQLLPRCHCAVHTSPNLCRISTYSGWSSSFRGQEPVSYWRVILEFSLHQCNVCFTLFWVFLNLIEYLELSWYQYTKDLPCYIECLNCFLL